MESNVISSSTLIERPRQLTSEEFKSREMRQEIISELLKLHPTLLAENWGQDFWNECWKREYDSAPRSSWGICHFCGVESFNKHVEDVFERYMTQEGEDRLKLFFQEPENILKCLNINPLQFSRNRITELYGHIPEMVKAVAKFMKLERRYVQDWHPQTIEGQMNRAKWDAQSLMQSILHENFSGKFFPMTPLEIPGIEMKEEKFGNLNRSHVQTVFYRDGKKIGVGYDDIGCDRSTDPIKSIWGKETFKITTEDEGLKEFFSSFGY